MDYLSAIGKRLALVLWAKDENDDDDVAVVAGELIAEHQGYFVALEDQGAPFAVREEWLGRIRPVSEILKDALLDAEYQLSLIVGHCENSDIPPGHVA